MQEHLLARRKRLNPAPTVEAVVEVAEVVEEGAGGGVGDERDEAEAEAEEEEEEEPAPPPTKPRARAERPRSLPQASVQPEWAD